jgi:hypothetical protein
MPGGTRTDCFNKCTSRFVNDITDPTEMGRWSDMKLRINDDINLHNITAYQVCNQGIKLTNSMSTYLQQYMYLKAADKEKLNPRKKYLKTYRNTWKHYQLTTT